MPFPSGPNSGGLALRLSTFFGALFLIYGVQLTYLPVWLDSRGLSAAEIAVACSAPMLVRLVLTPAVAFVADRAALHREMIVGSCAIALVLLSVLLWTWPVPALILIVIAMMLAVHTAMPLTDTITMAAVKAHALDYGRVRLWGSLSFILASYAAGFAVARYGPEAVLFLLIAGAAFAVAAALLLPRSRQQPGTAAASRLTPGEVVAFARDPRFLLFLAAAGAVQASHAVLYVFGVLHWRAQGLSAGFIASLWAIGVLAEIALFWGARWIAPLGAVELMLIGAGSGVVRWLAMALDPAPMLLVPLQILHAGTFAATHLGTMHWIATRVPAHTAGTAQALSSAFTAGVAMGGAMLVSGPLYAHLAGGAYLAMMGLCGLGLLAGLLLRRGEQMSAGAAGNR